jgi:hypothetical protein
MTRNEIEQEFSLTSRGTIKAPGKFEGEMLWVPYFYEATSMGESDADFSFGDGDTWVGFLIFQGGDFKEFPELEGSYGISLEENSQGFVSGVVYDTPEEYAADLAQVEKKSEEYHSEEPES